MKFYVGLTVLALGDSATLGEATEGSGEGSRKEWEAVRAERLVAAVALFSCRLVLRAEMSGLGSGEGGGVDFMMGATCVGGALGWGTATGGRSGGTALVCGDAFFGEPREGLPLRFGERPRI